MLTDNSIKDLLKNNKLMIKFFKKRFKFAKKFCGTPLSGIRWWDVYGGTIRFQAIYINDGIIDFEQTLDANVLDFSEFLSEEAAKKLKRELPTKEKTTIKKVKI